VAVLVFDQVEVLDFAGPLEVFAAAGQWLPERESFLEVFTVAERSPVQARANLKIIPNYSLEDGPLAEVLVVPGGLGARQEMNNPLLLDWLKQRAAQAELVLSVCTGALILARAGLLEGLAATTHHLALELLAEVAPRTVIKAGQRLVDNGRIITAAGVSAGIDGALYALARLLGQDTARRTAEHMEYDWRPEVGV